MGEWEGGWVGEGRWVGERVNGNVGGWVGEGTPYKISKTVYITTSKIIII